MLDAGLVEMAACGWLRRSTQVSRVWDCDYWCVLWLGCAVAVLCVACCVWRVACDCGTVLVKGAMVPDRQRLG